MKNKYRDILIFPKFNNIEKIQCIRKEKDRLFNVLDPHITIVFPFSDQISNDELIEKIEDIISNFNKFEVEFRGVSLSNDNYIYLNCVMGNDLLIRLHDEIYSRILPEHLRTDIEYVPHITLGQDNNIDFLNSFNETFETIIDEICIEQIGDNEESNIVKRIKLRG